MGAERSAPIIPPFVVGTAPPASGPLSASASSNCPGQVNRFQGGGALRLLRWVKAAWAWCSPVLRVVREACEISSRCFLSCVPGGEGVCRRIGVLKQGCADLHVGRIEEISHVQRQWPPAARESNALPLHLANAVGKAPHTEPTQSSARVRWAGSQGLLYALFLCEPPHYSLRLDTSMKTALRTDIMIFQIETGQPGIIPTDLFLPDEPFQQPLLRHPIEFSDETTAVLHEQPQRVAPLLQDPVGLRIHARQLPTGRFTVTFLNLHS